MRSQSAPLPRRNLTECATAYKEGRTTEAEQMFPAVVTEILPLIEYTIRKRTDDPNHIEDITQEALTRIWRILKRGIYPEIQLVTYHTTVDAHKKSTGMGDTRGGRSREYPEHARPNITSIEHTTEKADPYTSDAVIDAMDDAALLSELAAQDPHWSLVAQYRIEDLSQNQIATNLNTSRGEIRKTLAAIREYLERRAA